MNTNDDTEPLAHSFFGEAMTRDDRLPVIQAELIKQHEETIDRLVKALEPFADDYKHWTTDTKLDPGYEDYLLLWLFEECDNDSVMDTYKAAADVLAAIKGGKP